MFLGRYPRTYMRIIVSLPSWPNPNLLRNSRKTNSRSMKMQLLQRSWAMSRTKHSEVLHTSPLISRMDPNLSIRLGIWPLDERGRSGSGSRNRTISGVTIVLPAMKGGADRFPSSIYTESIDWKSLTPNSVVVDVGGNVGKVTYELYKAFPHLKYVVQDLPPVVKDTRNMRDSQSSLLPASTLHNDNPVLG